MRLFIIPPIPKLSLRLVLIVPFLLQITIAFGLTGWLSYRNRTRAINDLATQLQVEVSNRIKQEMNTYLETPHLINQINVDAINQGLISIDNIPALERYLWTQLQQFPTASYIGMGMENGDYIGAGRYDDGSIEFDILADSTNRQLEKWLTDDQGNRTELVSSRDNYDPRVRPWYLVAVEAGKPVWSEIYGYFGSQALVVSANRPINDPEGNLLGVASSDLTLKRISEFLGTLEIGKTGQTFIVERNGYLVGTSTLEKTFITDEENRDTERILAAESSDIMTRETARYLANKLAYISQIDNHDRLSFYASSRREFVQVTPMIDPRGIDWLIVVVVPEADFMEQIHENTRITILLFMMALVLAIILGILTARWISEPILRLSEASSAIASGARNATASAELNQKVKVEKIRELGMLSESFNMMIQNLRDSFIALENTNRELEQRVLERTAALLQEKERSEELLLNVLPKPIADQLKANKKAIASAIEEVTILFADIVGFTPLSARMNPIELVSLLNEMFSIFDNLAEKHKLEKIKTIGDAYMVVGGLPLPQDNHAQAIADMALEMQAAMKQFQGSYLVGSESFQIRIGINTGAVVAGVIGIKKFIYDLWGDAVNIASRMESSGTPGSIQVTEETYNRLKKNYIFKERGPIPVKGKGQMTTYWLLGKKPVVDISS
ncbi:MAG: adenylate/guanylate cyclase domain-containing protein [Limnospira maxima]